MNGTLLDHIAKSIATESLVKVKVASEDEAVALFEAADLSDHYVDFNSSWEYLETWGEGPHGDWRVTFVWKQE